MNTNPTFEVMFSVLLSQTLEITRAGGRQRITRYGAVGVLAVILIAAAPPAHAQIELIANLDGAQNIPPLDVPGTGTATLVLSADMTELAYEIHYAGLLGIESAAHFHKGNPRENGPAVFALPLGTPKIGVWEIPPDLVSEILEGRMYVNIHTDLYILGEIRGNIMQVVPVERTTWGVIKSQYER